MDRPKPLCMRKREGLSAISPVSDTCFEMIQELLFSTISTATMSTAGDVIKPLQRFVPAVENLTIDGRLVKKP